MKKLILFTFLLFLSSLGISKQNYGMAPGFNAPQRAMQGYGIPVDDTPFADPPPPPSVPLNGQLVVLAISGLALGGIKALKFKK